MCVCVWCFRQAPRRRISALGSEGGGGADDASLGGTGEGTATKKKKRKKSAVRAPDYWVTFLSYVISVALCKCVLWCSPPTISVQTSLCPPAPPIF